eukprot:m.87394 g.87394  ORF g.87394 m.87394 type:complete len:235 (+) comp50971_c0_seq1:80-784(+)
MGKPKSTESRVSVYQKDLDSGALDLSLSALTTVRVDELVLLLPRLIRLDLSSNALESLPELFCTLTSLQQLELRKNKLRTLPDAFGSLQSLKRLDLAFNPIETLPLSFGDLEQLVWLDLTGHQIPDHVIPDDVVGVISKQADNKRCARAVVPFLHSASAAASRRARVAEAAHAKEKALQEEADRIERERLKYLLACMLTSLFMFLPEFWLANLCSIRSVTQSGEDTASPTEVRG